MFLIVVVLDVLLVLDGLVGRVVKSRHCVVCRWKSAWVDEYSE
jgi:hypothetical protein